MTHITKDQSEARKAEVPSTEALRELIAKWRRSTMNSALHAADNTAYVHAKCADELDAILARAAELSAQDASPKYHSINCLSLQSEDNPPLPCDCGAGPTGLTPQEMETASPKDGWKLVPVEMTAWMRKFSGINEWRWKAALDAAPKPEPPHD